jgi:hypothetical protein
VGRSPGGGGRGGANRRIEKDGTGPEQSKQRQKAGGDDSLAKQLLAPPTGQVLMRRPDRGWQRCFVAPHSNRHGWSESHTRQRQARNVGGSSAVLRYTTCCYASKSLYTHNKSQRSATAALARGVTSFRCIGRNVLDFTK